MNLYVYTCDDDEGAEVILGIFSSKEKGVEHLMTYMRDICIEEGSPTSLVPTPQELFRIGPDFSLPFMNMRFNLETHVLDQPVDFSMQIKGTS